MLIQFLHHAGQIFKVEPWRLCWKHHALKVLKESLQGWPCRILLTDIQGTREIFLTFLWVNPSSIANVAHHHLLPEIKHTIFISRLGINCYWNPVFKNHSEPQVTGKRTLPITSVDLFPLIMSSSPVYVFVLYVSQSFFQPWYSFHKSPFILLTSEIWVQDVLQYFLHLFQIDESKHRQLLCLEDIFRTLQDLLMYQLIQWCRQQTQPTSWCLEQKTTETET